MMSLNSISRMLWGYVFAAAIILHGVPSWAQKKTVDSGWQMYAFPEGRTLEQAKQWAVEQAKVQALAIEFGTLVKSETVQLTSDFNGQVDEAFTELNVLQVRGEWLETTSIEGPTPEVKEGEIWWRVRVQGKATPLKDTRVALSLDVRGDVLGVESLDFLQDGDRLRARFKSPVDGYVMFFFAEDQVVYALSSNQVSFAEKVDGQRIYTLFSSESECLEAGAAAQGLERLARYAWKFKVTGGGVKESQAVLLGAFATHEFAPPNMDWDEDAKIWSMDEEAFERWLKQGTARSDHFQVERVPIRIRPKQQY